MRQAAVLPDLRTGQGRLRHIVVRERQRFRGRFADLHRVGRSKLTVYVRNRDGDRAGRRVVGIAVDAAVLFGHGVDIGSCRAELDRAEAAGACAGDIDNIVVGHGRAVRHRGQRELERLTLFGRIAGKRLFDGQLKRSGRGRVGEGHEDDLVRIDRFVLRGQLAGLRICVAPIFDAAALAAVGDLIGRHVARGCLFHRVVCADGKAGKHRFLVMRELKVRKARARRTAGEFLLHACRRVGVLTSDLQTGEGHGELELLRRFRGFSNLLHGKAVSRHIVQRIRNRADLHRVGDDGSDFAGICDGISVSRFLGDRIAETGREVREREGLPVHQRQVAHTIVEGNAAAYAGIAVVEGHNDMIRDFLLRVGQLSAVRRHDRLGDAQSAHGRRLAVVLCDDRHVAAGHQIAAGVFNGRRKAVLVRIRLHHGIGAFGQVSRGDALTARQCEGRDVVREADIAEIAVQRR